MSEVLFEREVAGPTMPHLTVLVTTDPLVMRLRGDGMADVIVDLPEGAEYLIRTLEDALETATP